MPFLKKSRSSSAALLTFCHLFRAWFGGSDGVASLDPVESGAELTTSGNLLGPLALSQSKGRAGDANSAA